MNFIQKAMLQPFQLLEPRLERHVKCMSNVIITVLPVITFNSNTVL